MPSSADERSRLLAEVERADHSQAAYLSEVKRPMWDEGNPTFPAFGIGATKSTA